MPSSLLRAKTATLGFASTPLGLLALAAIFHILLTLSIYALARSSVLAPAFDADGIAVSFAPDGLVFREEAAQLSTALATGQIRAWLNAPAPFHVKLYSICFAILGPMFGATILSAEPLNLFYYLTILVLIFYLGQEVIDRRAGLIAAAIVAVWPSFVLHTTQLLKDPAFMVGMLAFVLINLRFLSRGYSLVQALASAAAGGLTAIFIWLARDNMSVLLISTVLLAAAMLTVQQFSEKRFRYANTLGMALLIVLSIGVTRVVPKFRRPDKPPALQVVVQSESPNPLTRFVARVATLRERSTHESLNAASNVDSHVQLKSVGDLIRYLPRAAVVGFFSPFPNAWFAKGNRVGLAGRLLSGLETLAMYIFEALAIICLVRARRGASRRFSLWLLGLIAALGILSLGLVVVNVGTLYRLRYVFLFLIMILAAGGATQILGRFKSVTTTATNREPLTN